MKRNKPGAKVIAILAILPILLPIANTASAANASQLTLSYIGAVIDAGRQEYYVKGGTLLSLIYDGNPIQLSSPSLQYSLHATVNGKSATGKAEVELSGQTNGGSIMEIKISMLITGLIPAAYFPLTCNQETGAGCNSVIPSVFVGLATIKVSTDADGDNSATDTIRAPMLFENPYLNPFGSPIVISTSDLSKLSIMATYTVGKINWQNVRLAGQLFGSLDNQQVTGNFVMMVNSHEDLVSGTEQDKGRISFTDMSIKSLNGNGEFTGTSTIPKQGIPCSTATLPCTLTGLTSSGSFEIKGGSIIRGTYSTDWTTPAYAFSGTISATVEGH